MKITLDKELLIDNTVYPVGARVDIDDDIAQRHIENGHAHPQRPLPNKPVEPKPVETPSEPVEGV